MREKGTKPWLFMTLETAERIASEVARVGWKCKIVFAMHGEPTLNPKLVDIIGVFRKYLPKTVFHMYTNGYGINRADDTAAYLDRLFEAGINDILVDCYTAKGDWNFVDKIDIEKYNVSRSANWMYVGTARCACAVTTSAASILSPISTICLSKTSGIIRASTLPA
jgi:uncharacterized radical SAM superfamily Fe-S cluster-containing enzyme